MQAVLAIFSYGFAETERRFREAGVEALPLTGFEPLVGAARERGRLDEAQLGELEAWRANPISWSERV